MRTFTPLAPTTYNVAAFHFERSPEKLLGMRADALSQMLSFGNVGAGGRYIVVDGVGGLLAGAVLERLGGECDLACIGLCIADLGPRRGPRLHHQRARLCADARALHEHELAAGVHRARAQGRQLGSD
jgi:hypothetical protein